MKKYFLLCLVLLTSGIANAVNQNDKVNGTPGKGLTIVNSDGADVTEEEEEEPGGFVAINNDNDDYDFDGPAGSSLDERLDYEDDNGVAGENDLLKVKIEKNDDPERSGDYVLAFKNGAGTRRIRVWTTSTKQYGTEVTPISFGVNVSNENMTRFPSNIDGQYIWVEGVLDQKLPEKQLEKDTISLYFAGTQTQRPRLVDTISINIYRVIGATYVPDNSTFVYRAYVSDPTKSTGLVWTGHNIDSAQITTVPDKNDRREYSWGEGPFVGKVIVSPYKGFKCEREVYVVKVEMSDDPDESSILVYNPLSTVQQPNLRNIKSNGSGPAIQAECTIKTVEGPKPTTGGVAGAERGVRFMFIGIIQTVLIKSWNGEYNVNGESKKRISTAEGKYSLDGFTNQGSKIPWYDPIRAFSEDTTKPTVMRFYDTTPLENRKGTKLITNDTPNIPVVDQLFTAYHKNAIDDNQAEVTKFNLYLDFKVYASVMTEQGGRYADSAVYPSDDIVSVDRSSNYPQKLVSKWVFDGSGNMSAHPDYIWTSNPEDMTQNTVYTVPTDGKFTIEPGNKKVPLTEDKKSGFINKYLDRAQWEWE